ncbi:MAG: electron transfer flavoprotein subunit beta/FixA family protein [Mycobacteriales bacterium]
MRIALVAVKHVPVGGAFLRVEGARLTRDGVSHGIDAINEVALEWALQAREAGQLDRVVALSMGPRHAADSLRQAIAIGADEAILVSDERLAGADVRTTALVLAAVTTRLSAALLLVGYESLDSSSGAVPAATAAMLRWPLLSRFRGGELDGDVVRGQRDLGSGAQTVEADLPAVVSVVEGHVTPRYPKLKAVLLARTAPITTLTSADLGVTPATGNEVVVGLRKVAGVVKRARFAGFDDGVAELFSLLTGADGHG